MHLTLSISFWLGVMVLMLPGVLLLVRLGLFSGSGLAKIEIPCELLV